MRATRSSPYHSQIQLNNNISQMTYELEDLLDVKIIHGQKYYLVKWKHYDQKYNTWEPLNNLKYVMADVLDFENKHQAKIQKMRTPEPKHHRHDNKIHHHPTPDLDLTVLQKKVKSIKNQIEKLQMQEYQQIQKKRTNKLQSKTKKITKNSYRPRSVLKKIASQKQFRLYTSKKHQKPKQQLKSSEVLYELRSKQAHKDSSTLSNDQHQNVQNHQPQDIKILHKQIEAKDTQQKQQKDTQSTIAKYLVPHIVSQPNAQINLINTQNNQYILQVLQQQPFDKLQLNNEFKFCQQKIADNKLTAIQLSYHQDQFQSINQNINLEKLQSQSNQQQVNIQEKQIQSEIDNRIALKFKTKHAIQSNNQQNQIPKIKKQNLSVNKNNNNYNQEYPQSKQNQSQIDAYPSINQIVSKIISDRQLKLGNPIKIQKIKQYYKIQGATVFAIQILNSINKNQREDHFISYQALTQHYPKQLLQYLLQKGKIQL